MNNMSEEELIACLDRYEDLDIRNIMASELLSLRERLAIMLENSQATYGGITAQEWVAHGRDLAEKLKQTEARLNTSRATVGLYVEKLEALKRLTPFCHVFLHPDGPLFNEIVSDSCAGHTGVIPLFTTDKSVVAIRTLVESEIGDFCAGLNQSGEPVSPEEIQRQLLQRIIPLLLSAKPDCE